MTTQTTRPAIDSTVSGMSDTARVELEGLQVGPVVETDAEKAARITAGLDKREAKLNPNRVSAEAEAASADAEPETESPAEKRFLAKARKAVEYAKEQIAPVVAMQTAGTGTRGAVLSSKGVCPGYDATGPRSITCGRPVSGEVHLCKRCNDVRNLRVFGARTAGAAGYGGSIRQLNAAGYADGVWARSSVPGVAFPDPVGVKAALTELARAGDAEAKDALASLSRNASPAVK